MIIKIVKWLLILLGVIAAAITLFFVYMRYHDGPIENISGGPFSTGQLVQGTETDWSFIKDRATFEFQTMDPETSRTVWFAVVENKLYVGSAYMKTDIGKIWKQWPHYIERDNRALLRVDGKIYERKLIRLSADQVKETVTAEFMRKYNAPLNRQAVASGDVWLFELAPR